MDKGYRALRAFYSITGIWPDVNEDVIIQSSIHNVGCDLGDLEKELSFFEQSNMRW